jgi:hypothetical protein
MSRTKHTSRTDSFPYAGKVLSTRNSHYGSNAIAAALTIFLFAGSIAIGVALGLWL